MRIKIPIQELRVLHSRTLLFTHSLETIFNTLSKIIMEKSLKKNVYKYI